MLCPWQRDNRETALQDLLLGKPAIDVVAQQTDQIDILHLPAAADIVGLAQAALLQYQRNRGAMVLDIEPVADIAASP